MDSATGSASASISQPLRPPSIRGTPKRKQLQQPQDSQAARLAKAKNEPVVFPIVPDDPQAQELDTRQIDLSVMNVADLKSLCKDFRQHRVGRKDELLVRLVEFSEGGMDLWKNTIFAFATRPHNGPLKPTTKRKPNPREAWLNEAKPELPSHNPHVAQSQDRRTQAEKDKIKIATREIMSIVRQERKQNVPLRNSHLATTTLAAVNLPPSMNAMNTQTNLDPHPSLPSPPIPSPLDPLACQRYVQSITSARLNLHRASSTDHTDSAAGQNHGTSLFPPTGAQNPPFPSTILCANANISNTQNQSPTLAIDGNHFLPSTSTICARPNSPDTATVHRITIQIRGAPFVFTKDEVTAPDPLRFSDTKRLVASWDDDGWNPVYMPGSVYPVRIREQVPHVWEKEKNKWTQYRDFIREYRRLGETRFWETYSDAKGRMSFTALMKSMRARRAGYDNQLVAQAKAEYGRDDSDTYDSTRVL
ncbi:hypothetical protein CYLTODRAFT_13466 [Cylindrobasidium torrendii FP15055 ss-10]|uniref:SAP domain-containing protein n=1 Tax=Cylindrobasidium torrendii FP15055 ss-10 TaxID=1314674 RepID=A0A0D7BAA1_9AGAR|nr:hypothetical protein CYLTODRAFT_13466 [Cylindrobasidium torrendii FP15055 ss-10]